LTSPDKPSHGYEFAYRLAAEQLASINDIQRQCQRSGAQYLDTRKAITFDYLNRPYLVTLPDAKISVMANKEEEVPLRDKILILHYLTVAKGTPLSGKLIAYKELPEGTNYFLTFYHRSIKPLADCFGNETHRLLAAAESLDGRKADYGDAAVTVNAFPQVPMTLVLWRGDAEFTAEGNILFDSTIPDYLPVEDIIVLSETIVRKLIKRYRAEVIQ